MTTENNVAVIQTKIAPIIVKANAITIASNEDMIIATEVLSEMNQIMDGVEEEKNKVMRPLLDATAAERARWKPIETAYKAAIEPLRLKISQYQTQQMRAAKEAEAQLAEQIQNGTLDISEASQALSNQLQTPEKVIGNNGSISFKEQQLLKITDATKVPKKYWIIDELMVMKDLKEGIKVKGAEIEIIQVPVNRR